MSSDPSLATRSRRSVREDVAERAVERRVKGGEPSPQARRQDAGGRDHERRLQGRVHRSPGGRTAFRIGPASGMRDQ